jgi:hypothetical protein
MDDDLDEIKHKEVFINNTSFILETSRLYYSNLLQTNKIISGDSNDFKNYIYPLFCRDGSISDIKITSLDELLKAQQVLNKYQVELNDDELEILYEKINFSLIVKNVKELVFKKSLKQYLLLGIPRFIKNHKNKKLKDMLMEYIKKNLKNNNLDYDNFNYNTIKNYINQNNILRLIKLNKYSCVVLQLFKYIEDIYNVKLDIYIKEKNNDIDELIKVLKKK